MRKRNNLRIPLLILIICVVFISIGYAAYSTILNISSNANINRSAFSIHYDINSVNVLSGTDNGYTLVNPTNGPVFTSEDKNLSFTTTLNLNEETKFTVDVINDGTINARVSSINLKVSGKDETEVNYTNLANIGTNRWSNDYLEFYVVWTDGNKNILDSVDLEAGTIKNMTIVIRYKQPSDYKDLPSTNKNFKFDMDIDYVQTKIRPSDVLTEEL